MLKPLEQLDVIHRGAQRCLDCAGTGALVVYEFSGLADPDENCLTCAGTGRDAALVADYFEFAAGLARKQAARAYHAMEVANG